MIINLNTYDESKAENQQEREMMAQFNANAQLARKLGLFNTQFRVCGNSKTLINDEEGVHLVPNGEVWIQFKRSTYFSCVALNERGWFGLKAIWTKPDRS